RIEDRKRYDDAAWIGLGGNFIRLADVDEEVASIRHSLRHVLRHQIVHLVVRHENSPNNPSAGISSNWRPKSPLARRKSSIAGGLRQAKSLGQAKSLDGYLRSHFDHPSARNLEIIGGVVGGTAERDEEVILPARHAGMSGGLERTPRQEE